MLVPPLMEILVFVSQKPNVQQKEVLLQETAHLPLESAVYVSLILKYDFIAVLTFYFSHCICLWWYCDSEQYLHSISQLSFSSSSRNVHVHTEQM